MTGEKAPRTVLLVEDEALIALNERITLEEHGYRVIHAATGEAALDIMRRVPEIDIVLMDINLGSGIDGTEAAETILRQRDMPLVFLSSHRDIEVVEKTEKITSYGYIVKDSGEVVLLASIRMAFGLYESRKRERERQQALSKSEEHLRTTLNSIGDAVISTDLQGKISHMNPVAEKLTAWGLDQAKGKPLQEVFHVVNALTGEKQACPVKKVLASGGTEGLECHARLTGRDGKEYQIADSAAPIKDEQGAITGVVLVFRDVTEDYLGQERLRKSEDRLAKAMFAANDGLWDWDIARNTVFFDSRYYTMAGYEPDEFPHAFEEWARRVHPDDLPRCRQEIEAHLAGHTPVFDIEFRFLCKDGTWMWIRGRGKSVEKDHHGAVLRMIGTHSDITDRRRVEEALRDNERRFELALAGTGAGLWDWDMIHDRVYFSPRWKQMLGYNDHEVENTFNGWQSLWHPDDAAEIERAVQDYMEGKTARYEIEHRLRHKDGSWRTILTRGDLLRDQGGKPYRWVGTNIGVTHLKEMKLSLKRQLAEKEIILKETHHRIKNSIAAVKSLLSLQARSAASHEVKSALHEAIGRVNSIQQLYDRILITGDYHEVPANSYLEALTDSVILLFSGTARITLIKHFDHFSLSSKMLVPVGIILNELLTNTMKYAFTGRKNGQVRVSAIERKDLITLTIHDDGNAVPTGFDFNSSKGSGLMLVSMLTQQLEGNFTIVNDSGTLCTLEFKRKD